MRQGRRHREHVLGSESRREQRLMRIAKGRVRDEHRLVLRHPRDEALRAELLEALLGPVGHRSVAIEMRNVRLAVNRIRIESLDIGPAVDGHVAQVVQQTRSDPAVALELK